MTNSDIDQRIGAVLAAIVSNDEAAAAKAALELLGNALKNLNAIAEAMQRQSQASVVVSGAPFAVPAAPQR